MPDARPGDSPGERPDGNQNAPRATARAPAPGPALSAPALSGAAEPADTPPRPVADGAVALDVAHDTRYERRHVLGVGGMGRVRVMFDRRLGREVAHKEITAPSASPVVLAQLEARLAREAAITSRLEHPAIVPPLRRWTRAGWPRLLHDADRPGPLPLRRRHGRGDGGRQGPPPAPRP